MFVLLDFAGPGIGKLYLGGVTTNVTYRHSLCTRPSLSAATKSTVGQREYALEGPTFFLAL